MNQDLYCNTTRCRMAYVVKGVISLLKERFQNNDIALTIEQFFILNILDKEEGLILQELAEIVERDKSAVLRHIDALEKNHFVSRVTDQQDKRRKLLIITKPGLQTLESARAVDKELDREITRQIKNIALNDFENALSSMNNYLYST